MPLHTNSHRDIKNACEVRSTGLRLSTVSKTSQLNITVSLATTTTINHLALPWTSLHWRLSVLACCYWLSGAAAFLCVCFSIYNRASGSSLGLVVLSSFSKCPHLPFPFFSLVCSCFHAPLSRSCSVCFSQAGGPVGLWVGALFHQPGASVRGLFHFASWC